MNTQSRQITLSQLCQSFLINKLANILIAIMLVQPWFSGVEAQEEGRFGLADLAGYRAALSGKPTADDAKTSDTPIPVGFHDLWERPDAFRGRRVAVEGRVVRIFRQPPVGSFPALAEVWITSTSGNPFCLVSPQTGSIPIPEPGRDIRFTGTFLKMLRYAASDGARLAPLIVGERPPTQPPTSANRGSDHPAFSLDGWSWSPATWALGLSAAALAGGLLARWHLNSPPPKLDRRAIDRGTSDPPLEFIDQEIHIKNK
jgi:hypothetical protein